MRNKSYILKTQLSITYPIGVIIIFFMALTMSIIISKEYGLLGIILGVCFTGFAATVVMNYFLNMRTIYFYNTYLVEKFHFRKRSTIVPYKDISEMQGERDLYEMPEISHNPFTVMSAPGDIIITDDKIVIITKDFNKINITATMFDNYEVINAFVIHNIVKKRDEQVHAEEE